MRTRWPSLLCFLGACTWATLLAACGGGNDDPALAAGGGGTETPMLQSFQAADTVIGQADFNAVDDNPGAQATARLLYFPMGRAAWGPDGELYVPDNGNHRVLRFSAPLPATGATADLVLGQADLTSRDNTAVNDTSLSSPGNVDLQGNRLAVADGDHGRVLLWNRLPQGSAAPADLMLGQTNFGAISTGCNADHFGTATRVALGTDGSRLVVVDQHQARVLIWNRIPSNHGTPPDLVLGQNSFTTCVPNDETQSGMGGQAPTARTLFQPSDAWTDGQRLVVSDAANHRVLIWNRFPTSSFQPADVVLGQSGFMAMAANDDDQNGVRDAAPSARTLDTPRSVHSNGQQLAVADFGNNRVLVWNQFPTTSFQPADAVLGQNTFTGMAANDSDQDGSTDTPSARTMSGPTGVRFDGGRLAVSLGGPGGNRVLVFGAR